MKQGKVTQVKALVMTGCLTAGLLLSGLAQTASASLLTTLRLGDGSLVEFHEPVAGEVAVLSQSPVDSQDKPSMLQEVLKSLDGGDINVVDAYRLLSGGDRPPEELLRAQAQVDEARQADKALVDIPAPPEELMRNESTQSDDKADQFRLAAFFDTGSWFRENYCRLTTDYCYCMLYRTGSGNIVRYTGQMRSVTYPYRGTVTHKLEYWFLYYHTSIQQNVPEGWIGHILVSGGHKFRRASMSNASGDGFHWSVNGGLTLGCTPYPCYCPN